jgi:hypothetical protein
MSDHEFEKQVKQKMDELRFTPSDAVWNKVAGELRKDRPRRRGWVLLPLLAIGLGAGGYFFYQKNLASDKNITLTANETNKTSSTESVAGNNLRAINDSAALLDNGELVNPATSTLKRSGHKDNNRSGVAADGARLKEKEVENINPSVKKTGRTSTGAEIGMKNELSAAETKTADAERKTNKTTGADSQTVNANNETTDAEKNTAATDKKVTAILQPQITKILVRIKILQPQITNILVQIAILQPQVTKILLQMASLRVQIMRVLLRATTQPTRTIKVLLDFLSSRLQVTILQTAILSWQKIRKASQISKIPTH